MSRNSSAFIQTIDMHMYEEAIRQEEADKNTIREIIEGLDTDD